jgi:hypothetical protein
MFVDAIEKQKGILASFIFDDKIQNKEMWF